MAYKSSDSVDPPMASKPSRRLASILLDKKVYLRGSRNETTATAESKDGYAVAFSFWMADTPGMSFFSISLPDARPPFSVFRRFPHVVGAEGRFVLFRARFLSRRMRDEYFMYRAGCSPSLELVPLPDGSSACLSWVTQFGIVPCGDDGGHYLLAAFCDAMDTPATRPAHHQLRIYFSERKEWVTRTLPNLNPRKERFVPEKVITLGESVLGWVDFLYGLLECDLRQDPPCVRFIPLPEPFPGNREKLKPESTFRGATVKRSLRDLACVNGVVKFIEMEHLEVTETPCDPSDRDVFYDSDLIMLLERKDTDKKPKPIAGWRAVTWSRALLSNCWRKGCTVHVDDIFVDESTYLSLLSGPRGEAVGKFTFRNLYSVLPTLSADDDDILYLKSMEQPKDENGWIVAVDLRYKTVKAIQMFFFDGLMHDFLTCTLSRHLDMTPGIKVSACCENTEMVSSGSDPSHTPIGVDELISCESRSRLPLHRLWPEEFNRGRNEAPKIPRDEAQNFARNKPKSVVRNDHSSRDRRPGSTEESTCKFPRLLLEKKRAVHARIEAQLGVQSDHISWFHPVENNQPSQQCFNKWHGPCDTGYSSWPHQKNLDGLNKVDGPCNPVFAPLPPAPKLHGYGNYQTLCQQPHPSKQHLMPTGEFGPHEAPQPCIKHLGYTQQVPAPNSFIRTHSGYGNYQQYCQQLPSIQELPALASLQQQPSAQHQPTLGV